MDLSFMELLREEGEVPCAYEGAIVEPSGVCIEWVFSSAEEGVHEVRAVDKN
jgi:hypothetical protein